MSSRHHLSTHPLSIYTSAPAHPAPGSINMPTLPNFLCTSWRSMLKSSVVHRALYLLSHLILDVEHSYCLYGRLFFWSINLKVELVILLLICQLTVRMNALPSIADSTVELFLAGVMASRVSLSNAVIKSKGIHHNTLPPPGTPSTFN